AHPRRSAPAFSPDWFVANEGDRRARNAVRTCGATRSAPAELQNPTVAANRPLATRYVTPATSWPLDARAFEAHHSGGSHPPGNQKDEDSAEDTYARRCLHNDVEDRFAVRRVQCNRRLGFDSRRWSSWDRSLRHRWRGCCTTRCGFSVV